MYKVLVYISDYLNIRIFIIEKLYLYFIITSKIYIIKFKFTGTNGDREMIASLMMANFDVFDVTMSDLQSNKITLDAFQGLVFPGGFSYAGMFLI